MDFDLKKKLVPFLVFFIVANPMTFKLVRSLLGDWVANAQGCPTTSGLLLHALVFVLVAHLVWRLVYGSMKSRYSSSPMVSDTVPGEIMDGAECQ